MVALAAEVTAGVVFRYSGHSLVWYDEVATDPARLGDVLRLGAGGPQARAHRRARDRGMLPPGPRVAAAVARAAVRARLLRAARLGGLLDPRDPRGGPARFAAGRSRWPMRSR